MVSVRLSGEVSLALQQQAARSQHFGSRDVDAPAFFRGFHLCHRDSQGTRLAGSLRGGGSHDFILRVHEDLLSDPKRTREYLAQFWASGIIAHRPDQPNIVTLSSAGATRDAALS
jgi:hypothetical protein